MTAQGERIRSEGKAPGWVLGSLGVASFSLTLPATRLADPAFGALTVGVGRAVLAAALAAVVLRVRGEPLVMAALNARLAVVAAGTDPEVVRPARRLRGRPRSADGRLRRVGGC